MTKQIEASFRPVPGMREKEAASLLSARAFKKAGGEAFSPIVAFGRQTFYPHHVPGAARYRRGNTVLLDLGVKLNGYCADLTRIKGLFNIDSRLKKAYGAVEKARRLAIDLIKPGVRIGTVDRKIKDFFHREGYGGCVLHSLGHGIGLDVHEWPSITKSEKARFERGMVFTLEPGLYLRGIGGVRKEDIYVLGDKVRELG